MTQANSAYLKKLLSNKQQTIDEQGGAEEAQSTVVLGVLLRNSWIFLHCTFSLLQDTLEEDPDIEEEAGIDKDMLDELRRQEAKARAAEKQVTVPIGHFGHSIIFCLHRLHESQTAC